MSGLTTEGFETKTLDQIKTEVSDDVKDGLSASLKTTSDSVVGVLIGIFSGKVQELWEVLQAIYRAQYPDTASGDALDNVAAITGATRLEATKSTVSIIATGTPGTLIPLGRVVSVDDVGDRFVSLADETIVAATAWTITTPYVVGDIRTNSGNIYIVTIAGTSAGAGGPSGTGTAIVDGTVTWRFLGAGTGFIDIDFASEDYGPVNANAFTLIVIDTPVGGWDNATNLLDADQGRNIETDAEFRLRREQLLRAQGKGTVDAIRAAVREILTVDEVYVFENTTGVTDGDGLPPKSFEVVVRSSPSTGDEQEIAEVIWDQKPAGIETYGTEAGVPYVVVDDQGFSHDIYFSRPTELDIYIDVTLDVDGNYPVDGDDQVKEILVAFGETLNIGDDVIRQRIESEVFKIPGVIDIISYFHDTSPSPVSTANIPVGNREIAAFDTSRITVS